MNQLNDWIKRLPDINSRISIVLILLLLVVLMYILFSNMKQQGRDWGEQWTEPITEYSKAVDEMLNNAKINKGTHASFAATYSSIPGVNSSIATLDG